MTQQKRTDKIMSNHLIKRIVFFLILMVLFYLIVAFVTLKIDFREWGQETRIIYMLISGSLSILLAANPFIIKYD